MKIYNGTKRKLLILALTITAICLVVATVGFILHILNKIDLGISNLMAFSILPFLLLGVVSYIGLVIAKCIDYKQQKGYEEKEKRIIAYIATLEKYIFDIKEYIYQTIVRFECKMSKVKNHIQDLDIRNIGIQDLSVLNTTGDDNIELFEDLKASCIEYLCFLKDLYDKVSDCCVELYIPKYSGYGKYIEFKKFSKSKISEVQKGVNDELGKKYAKVKQKYEKFHDKIISQIGNCSEREKIISLLDPDRYDFAHELLRLRVQQFRNTIKLAYLKQDLIDIQYKLGEENGDKILQDLIKRERGEGQVVSQSISSTTVASASHKKETGTGTSKR